MQLSERIGLTGPIDRRAFYKAAMPEQVRPGAAGMAYHF